MIFQLDTLVFSVGDWILTGFWALLVRAVLAVLLALAGWAASRILKATFFPKLIAVSEKGRLKSIPILAKGFARPAPILAWTAGLYLALSSLPWAVGLRTGLQHFFTLSFRIIIICCITAGLWASSSLCTLLFSTASAKFDLNASRTVNTILAKVYRALLVIFSATVILNELGFNISGLITGVGLAGLTVSLAAQDSASNLFSGLMILIEHPFGIGDWISVGGVEGTVEDLTFRSTKVRALDNSLYVLPNSAVSSATVNNGTNRTKRLFRFTLGVTYDATRPQLERLMADLEAMLKGHSEVFADSVTVRLSGFGDSSIDILVSCYINTIELPKFLAVQNALNLDIMDVMEKNKTSFAFPSTSVYVEKAAKPE